jgi:hypothetical protein
MLRLVRVSTTIISTIVTTTTIATTTLMGLITAMLAGQEHGADGTCARRSAVIPAHPIILHGRGLTMDQMPVAQP